MATVRLVRLELVAELLMRRERVHRDRTNIFEVLDENELQRRFRFSRAGIAYLAELLRDGIEHLTRRSHAFKVDQQCCSRYHQRAGIEGQPHRSASQ
ncbi:hypothetical protein HPB49_005983 [Dermacentor silvarum]|uniref:Uncharacterized protein n=1 Tax=Dermacentor silvarum TaxID=543639 RepID=A0ACB8CDH0_DERSI|nr:hypothetical protein HPB49_005983 [Dermacentor silvarum]